MNTESRAITAVLQLPPMPAGKRKPIDIMWEATAIAVALAMLLAPALWNRFPLLEFDTGGYLARWYEGYLVPSRSTVFGLFLHVGEHLSFWPELLIQSGLTIWVIAIALRVFGLGGGPWRVTAVVAALGLATGLPWLSSLLLTDIFAGLAVLSLHLMLFHPDGLRRWERYALVLLIAFSAATHNATMAVLMAQLLAGAATAIFHRVRAGDILRGVAAIGLGAIMLVAANFAVSGEVAWTPGGAGLIFGRMLQDGIVGRYLADHCPDPRLKLCPFRNALPPTADEFLWGRSPFNQLGRFTGLADEMQHIVLGSLLEYPAQQITTALADTAEQLVMVGTGYGVHDNILHTYGIIARYLPRQAPAMRAARQQHGELGFDAINRIDVPLALLSMILTVAIVAWAAARRQFDDIALLATSVVLTLLANAFVCGALSGPHDRYGARIVWIATFAVMVAAMRRLWPGQRATGRTAAA